MRRASHSNLVGGGNFIEMVLGSQPVGVECERNKCGGQHLWKVFRPTYVGQRLGQ